MDNSWIESKLEAMDKKIDVLTDLVKNHLQHHFIFTMGALAAAVAIAVALIKVVWG